MATDVLTAAIGRWPEILHALAGLATEKLSNRHQSCPLCGGRDRYRFDDRDGSGSWFCNQCGGKDRMGGGGSGIDLLMRSRNWSFRQACQALERYLDLPPHAPGRHRPQLTASPNGAVRPSASAPAPSALPGHPT
ncbi:MAG: primase-helicase zinc-binding domain-containing protein, partial [Prochlorococcaceae cyanobacterium]